MANENKSGTKELQSGMYDCVKVGGKRDGEKVIYHSSTAETLAKKGLIKVGKRIKKYVKSTMRQ